MKKNHDYIQILRAVVTCSPLTRLLNVFVRISLTPPPHPPYRRELKNNQLRALITARRELAEQEEQRGCRHEHSKIGNKTFRDK
jgi:hypothetical protein